MFYVARLNINNTLDSTFGNAGLMTYDAGEEGNSPNLELQSDGKILLLGNFLHPGFTNNDTLILRINPNGTLDTTFSNDGIVVIDYSNSENLGNLDIASDGKIILSGKLILPIAK